MTIFGQNENEVFEKNTTNYGSPGHYNDKFKLFKHLNRGSILKIMHFYYFRFSLIIAHLRLLETPENADFEKVSAHRVFTLLQGRQQKCK